MILNRKKFIFSLVLFFITIFCYFIFRNPNIFFVTNMILLTLTIIKCKFSFFSLKSILIGYTLFPFFFKYNFNMYYGLFQYTSNDYYIVANIIVFIYLFVWYLLYQNTKILEFEREKLTKKIDISISMARFFAYMAILITLVRFPTLPFLKEYDRFVSLLPGNGWNHLAIIFLLFSIPKIKDSMFIKLAFIFVIVWFFGHYERVDCIGLIMLLVLLYFSKIRVTTKNISILFVIILSLFFMLTSIEFIRVGSNFNFKTICSKIFINSTASDVAYTFDRSIDFKETKGLLYGKTYFKYVKEIIPMIEYKDSSINYLNNNYYTVGGEFILNEPYMNFGYIGILIFIVFEFIFLYFILKTKGFYGIFGLFTLIFSVFRIVWYGISYVETALIWYIPVIILFIKFLKKWKEKLN